MPAIIFSRFSNITMEVRVTAKKDTLNKLAKEVVVLECWVICEVSRGSCSVLA